MPVVRETLVTPDNTPIEGVRVALRLVAATSGEALGYDPVEVQAVGGRTVVHTDDTGLWEAELEANELITPANTVYEIAANVPGARPIVRYIDVPDGAGPYEVQDILTAPPEDLVPGATTVSIANAIAAERIKLGLLETTTDDGAITVEIDSSVWGMDLGGELYYDPNGADPGEEMLLRDDAGAIYWIPADELTADRLQSFARRQVVNDVAASIIPGTSGTDSDGAAYFDTVTYGGVSPTLGPYIDTNGATAGEEAFITLDPDRGLVFLPLSDPNTWADVQTDMATQVELDAHTARTDNPHAVTKTQVGLANADNTTDANKPISTATQSALDAKQSLSEKGLANGYASLDLGGKIPANQLPSTVMEFQGIWDATTNTPTIVDGTGSAGDVYRVSVAGTRNLGSGAQTFAIGDWVVYNGSIWQQSDNSESVVSVFGRSGIITAQSGDYTATQVGLGNVVNALQLQAANNLSDLTSAATARSNLGVAIGSQVQAYDADLDTWATKTAPSGATVGTTDTQTLTNKRVTKRVQTIADTATLILDTDSYDGGKVAELSQATAIGAPTGTPTAFQQYVLRIKSTTARALTWNAAFRASTVPLPTTTVAGKHTYVGLQWNSDDSKWDCLAYTVTV